MTSTRTPEELREIRRRRARRTSTTSLQLERLDADVLVVGSGFAGLWAAIAAKDEGADRVVIVDKGDIARSSQSRLSAGATIYLLPEDDLDAWVRDVAEANSWLSRQDLVTAMLETSFGRLSLLDEWGVRYARIGGEGDLLRLPSRGFRTLQMLVQPEYRGRLGGSAVTTALREQVMRRKCTVLPRYFVTDLLTGDGAACGAIAIERATARPIQIRARAVVLAAGDCSFRGNYACTDSATGDAFRLAFDAGARLSNMEFLCTNTGSPLYAFEGTGIATRFGATFRDSAGRAFMASHHPDGDTAEVGYVVQAMAKEAESHSGPPFTLDFGPGAAPGGFLRYALHSMGGFMPRNLAKLSAEGIEILDRPQEWVPAIQTLRGGARTGVDCATDVPGLFAAGTAQALDPGLFNGWSSMRAMWSGQQAGKSAAGQAASSPPVPPDPGMVEEAMHRASAPAKRETISIGPGELVERLQAAIFPHDVSVLKSDSALGTALAEVRGLGEMASELGAEDPHQLVAAHEAANMLRTAELFLLASLERRESRGDHFRSDHPTTSTDYLHWLNIRRGAAGPAIETELVPLDSFRFSP